MSLPKVAVLMCTYNGERFLEQQLKSIFSQSRVQIVLYVNDDGSDDSTLGILESFQNGNNVVITRSERIGSSVGYRNLLQLDIQSDYFAFSDQDDIWHHDKLITLIETIGETVTPSLAFSNRNYVSSEGFLIGRSKVKATDRHFNFALWENLAPGNTQLLNLSAVQLLREKYLNTDTMLIDAWIFLIISFCGNVQFVPESLVSYRLHESNQIGIPHILKRFRNIYKTIQVHQNLNQSLFELGPFPNNLNVQVLQNELRVLKSRNLAEFLRFLLFSSAGKQSRSMSIAYRICKVFYFITHKI